MKCKCQIRNWFVGDKSWTYQLQCPVHGKGKDCGIIPVEIRKEEEMKDES